MTTPYNKSKLSMYCETAITLKSKSDNTTQTQNMDNNDINNDSNDNLDNNNDNVKSDGNNINKTSKSYRYNEDEEKKLNELSQNFIVYYYSSNLSDFNENIDKVNRVFNIYMKRIIDERDLGNINKLLEFINSITIDNDIYNLKSGNNISNLFKYINQSNLIVNYSISLSDNIVELLNYVYYNKIKVKTNLYYNLINITYTNFTYFNSNFDGIIKKYGYVIEEVKQFNEKQRIRELNLEVYNKLIDFILLEIKGETLWLSNDYIVKLHFILSCNKYLNKDLIIIFRKHLGKFTLINYDKHYFATNGIIQKEKIKLRNTLINFKKHNIKSAINIFMHNYNYLIDKFVKNRLELNVLIDGRNVFYSKKDSDITNNNIDIQSIKAFDSKINSYYKPVINTKLVNNNVLHPQDRRKYNFYLIFNENHRNVLEPVLSELKNCSIIYTPSGTNDDIIQLYLWLSYLGCVLISSDKHSNYISRITSNNYLHGLFMEYKRLFQITL